MNLGKRLINIRKENKMSQEEFSEIFNVTRQTISNWENSKSYPDIETIVKISDYFNISLDILLKEDKKMVKEIDKKVKKNKKFKIIISILILIIFLGVSWLLAKYLFPEKFEDFYNMPVAMVMYKLEDDTYGTHVSDYHIEYNKIFKYPIAKAGTHGASTQKERNVSKMIQNMPEFKTVEEQINYVKKLYEKEGMTVLVVYLKNSKEYSKKYMEFYEKIISMSE